MSEHGEFQPARWKRRVAARAVDTLVTAAWAFVVLMAAGVTGLHVSFTVDGWDGGRDTFWLTLSSLLASIPIASYEVAATARRGQAFGKRIMGLKVVRWDKEAASPYRGSASPGAWPSTVRWAVPHGSGVIAAVIAGTVPTNSGHGAIVGACAWLVVSSAMYLPSLLDPNGRGWHDKAAGTVVITARN